MNINKFSFGFLSVFKTKKMLKKLQAFLGDKINAYISTRGHVIEITDKKANKALATEQYLSIKQIELQDTIHIGDSMTDACLKGYVGKLVAMGNSPAGFKRIADEVAPKNKRSGIHKYLIKKQTKNESSIFAIFLSNLHIFTNTNVNLMVLFMYLFVKFNYLYKIYK